MKQSWKISDNSIKEKSTNMKCKLKKNLKTKRRIKDGVVGQGQESLKRKSMKKKN